VNAFSIRLPSLRERPVDIPVLAERFLSRYCASNGLGTDGKVFGRDAVDRLVSYPWPGNIRELESTVSRAALSSPGRVIRASDVVPAHGRTGAAGRVHAHSDDAGRRTGAGTARARKRGLEQEGGRARARYQPRHALPQDRGVRVVTNCVPSRDTGSHVKWPTIHVRT